MIKNTDLKISKILRVWCTNSIPIGLLLTSAACVDYNTDNWAIVSHRVETVAENGAIVPNFVLVKHGETITFSLVPEENHALAEITGCHGSLSSNGYTIGPVLGDCVVTARFVLNSHTVDSTQNTGGRIEPDAAQVLHGDTASFTLIPDTGYHVESVTGCNGTLMGNSYVTGPVDGECTISATFHLNDYTLTATAGPGGDIVPPTTRVRHGDTASFTLIPDPGYHVESVTGCNGLLTGTVYTTGPITADCIVNATFHLNRYTITTDTGSGGSIIPVQAEVSHGGITRFTVTPYPGYRIGTVSGCGGFLSGTTYTTGAITSGCTIDAGFIRNPPPAATLAMTISAVKRFRFEWNDITDATFYRLLADPDGGSGFTQLGAEIPAGTRNVEFIVPLYARIGARYLLQSCNEGGCTDSFELPVATSSLTSGIGYFKPSNTSYSIWFGASVSLSADGTTMAVGAPHEDSDATGINGDQYNYRAADAGAVYVFVRNGASWSQQAYIKAGNTDARDQFGSVVRLSDDGDTLVVSAPYEDSSANGIDGDHNDDSMTDSGAVYVFTRTGSTWSQQAYIKPHNTGAGDRFGERIDLDGSGDLLAVAAPLEDSSATGIDSPVDDDTLTNSGAVYLFRRTGNGWAQEAYIKAAPSANEWLGRSIGLSGDGGTLAIGKLMSNYSGKVYLFSNKTGNWALQASFTGNNTTGGDQFARSLALSRNGDTLAVGAPYEDSSATGVGGDPYDNGAFNSGAAYIFVRNGTTWSQQAYIKASNTGREDWFGETLSLSDDGDTLAVGAPWENGGAAGFGGDETDDSLSHAGAAYLFARDGIQWHQTAYLKAKNPGAGDRFGAALCLGNDTLAVGALFESSGARGINQDPDGSTSGDSGAIYLY